MKTLRLLLLIAAVPVLTVARADAPAATKGDLGKFQGSWTTTFGTEGNLKLTVTFKESAVTVSGTTPDGDAFEIMGEVRLNDEAKPHKTLDWVKFAGPDGNDLPDNLSIYKFDDADTIRICNGGPGQERPTEFKQGDGAHPSLLVLKREKN
jgi:uncharacterized protein (TIGR03067 family)